MPRALIVVDIQNDYFPGGANPLDRPEEAAEQASRLLEAFRASGEHVVHVQHVWDEPDASFMRPGTPGVEIHEAVAPQPGEAVLQKAWPNAFRETSLEDDLRTRGVDELVVCGMMTAMCVDATVRAGADLGFRTTVAHDACATCELEFGGQSVPAPAGARGVPRGARRRLRRGRADRRSSSAAEAGSDGVDGRVGGLARVLVPGGRVGIGLRGRVEPRRERRGVRAPVRHVRQDAAAGLRRGGRGSGLLGLLQREVDRRLGLRLLGRRRQLDRLHQLGHLLDARPQAGRSRRACGPLSAIDPHRSPDAP